MHYELYRDPGKGNVIADSGTTTTLTAFIFTRYCLLSIFYRFTSTIENLFRKKYIEGALMSKSRNIALTQISHFGNNYFKCESNPVVRLKKYYVSLTGCARNFEPDVACAAFFSFFSCDF